MSLLPGKSATAGYSAGSYPKTRNRLPAPANDAGLLVRLDRQRLIAARLADDAPQLVGRHERLAGLFDLDGRHTVTSPHLMIRGHQCQDVVRGDHLDTLEHGLGRAGGDNAPHQGQRVLQRRSLGDNLHESVPFNGVSTQFARAQRRPGYRILPDR